MHFNKDIKIIFENKKNNYDDYKRFEEEYEKVINKFSKVIVLMKRTPNLLFLLMLLLEKGITFILVNPDYPEDRIKHIIEKSGADGIFSNVINAYTIKTKNANTLNEIAYLIYTSGSTGEPKGVEITYEALDNFVEGVSELIDFSPSKSILCLTTITFDIFILESIMALYKGLTVVLANEEEQRNPKLMARIIEENNVDMIQMTPSRMQLLLNHDKDLNCLKNVKDIMIGGEPFPIKLLKTLQIKTNAKIYNMYGPTETTIWSTVSELTYKDRIDIGKPIKNTEVYILDDNLNIVPNGQVGEICISGKGLARGYLGMEDLTAEKFIYPMQMPKARVYKTGDLGRYLSDRNLDYLGRLDNQVKIRGHRIELEEIETHINQFTGVLQSVVVSKDMNESDKFLEVFYTSELNIKQEQITNYLSEKLPMYMIPVKYTRVKEFSYTTNGKIDRKKTYEGIRYDAKDELVLDETLYNLSETQGKVLEIIKSNLDQKAFDSITFETSLSNAGIDSITFIRIIVALEEAFSFECDDEMLLVTAFPTVNSMIEYVELKVSSR